LNAYAVQRQNESSGLLHSFEYLTNLVKGWYLKYLGRTADPLGFQNNVAELVAGIPDEQVIAGLIGSQEYLQNQGSSNLLFLHAAYLDILGRPLDSSGQAAYLSQLMSGTSRATVALELLSSTEYRNHLIGGFYSNLLGRTASGGEVSGWVAAMAAGLTDEQVINAFLTTGEYFLRTHAYP
jgi:hypothetical protein